MRRLLFLVAFVLAGWGTGAAVLGLVADAPVPRVNLDAWQGAAKGLERLERSTAAGPKALFFGDSTAIFYRPPDRVPGRLQKELRRANDGWRVFSVGYSGAHTFDAYYLAEPMLAARPDLLILSLNPFCFEERRRTWAARPELAAWIPPSRWLEAASLPLHWQGVTLDALVLRSLALRIFGIDALARMQRRLSRIGSTWQDLGEALDASQDRRPTPRSEGDRFRALDRRRSQNATELARRYGASLAGVPADHPVLALLGAAVGRAREAGVDVWVYWVPTNVETLARVGLLEGGGLARTIERTRRTVEDRGGHFVDLHALLPDAAFRDLAGHLSTDEGHHGPQRLAEALARALLSGQRDAGARGR